MNMQSSTKNKVRLHYVIGGEGPAAFINSGLAANRLYVAQNHAGTCEALHLYRR